MNKVTKIMQTTDYSESVCDLYCSHHVVATYCIVLWIGHARRARLCNEMWVSFDLRSVSKEMLRGGMGRRETASPIIDDVKAQLSSHCSSFHCRCTRQLVLLDSTHRISISLSRFHIRSLLQKLHFPKSSEIHTYPPQPRHTRPPP